MGVKGIIAGMGGNNERYDQLEVILKENWQELKVENKNLATIIDPGKLSKMSTKDLKQLMRNFPTSDLALVLNLKVKMSNKKAYKNFRSREKKDQVAFPKELQSLSWQKIGLLEERSNLINEISLYKELSTAEKSN